jgi:hypothetical protein
MGPMILSVCGISEDAIKIFAFGKSSHCKRSPIIFFSWISVASSGTTVMHTLKYSGYLRPAMNRIMPLLLNVLQRGEVAANPGISVGAIPHASL